VRYYLDSAGGGTEPSAKPVPNERVDLLEDGQAPDLTDAAGFYSFPSQSGTRTVTALAKFGSPRASDHNDAVSSLDAAYVGQAAVLARTLSANQRLAADASGNNQITAFDAALVSQFAAEMIDHLPVAVSRESDWALLRCDHYVDATNQDCGQPVFVHGPLVQSETDDFYAVLYGEVTGNWQPVAPLGLAGSEAAPAVPWPTDGAQLKKLAAERATAPSALALLSMEGARGGLAEGERRRIELKISGAEGILGLDLAMGYDSTRIRIVGVETLGLGSGLQLMHSEGGGTLRIGMFGPLPLRGSGALLAVTVEAVKAVRGGVEVQVSGQANEGAIPLRVVRGAGERRSRSTGRGR